MGGSAIGDDWELTSPSNGARTVVLVGRTGNGKSATGNSILGRKAFVSKASSSGITSTCQLQRIMLSDGQIMNVIDTPGLFDFSAESEFVGKEIVKCINFAKDGIHAVLVVFSVRSRFSKEEEAALHTLRMLFGDKIVNYMIVVFTGGDELEDNDETLVDYLGRECPEPLKDILQMCNDRCVLFDNKTKDELKKRAQLQQLLFLINKVVDQNNGLPYSDKLFSELKGALRLLNNEDKVDSKNYSREDIDLMKQQMERSYDEQLKKIADMVETKLRATFSKLEKQLVEEQNARIKAEERAHVAQMKSNDEIQRLRESLDKARKETEELRLRTENPRCTIL